MLVGGALQFTDLLQRGVPGREPVSYVITGLYSMFELKVAAHGRSPTPCLRLYSLLNNVLTLSRAGHLPFPPAIKGGGKGWSPGAVHSP